MKEWKRGEGKGEKGITYNTMPVMPNMYEIHNQYVDPTTEQ
jgi:hypothetical protein